MGNVRCNVNGCLFVVLAILVAIWVFFQPNIVLSGPTEEAPIQNDFCQEMSDLWSDYCDENFSDDPWVHHYCNNQKDRWVKDCKEIMK